MRHTALITILCALSYTSCHTSRTVHTSFDASSVSELSSHDFMSQISDYCSISGRHATITLHSIEYEQQPTDSITTPSSSCSQSIARESFLTITLDDSTRVINHDSTTVQSSDTVSIASTSRYEQQNTTRTGFTPWSAIKFYIFLIIASAGLCLYAYTQSEGSSIRSILARARRFFSH